MSAANPAAGPRVGIRVPPCERADTLVKTVRWAKQLGFDEAWFFDSQLLWRTVFTVPTPALGTAVTDLVPPHPAVVVSAAHTLKPICASLAQNGGAPFLAVAGIELDVPVRIEGVYPDPLHAEGWETAVRTCSKWVSDQGALRFARKFCLFGTAEEIADRMRSLHASAVSGGLPPARRLLRSADRPGRERGHPSAAGPARRGLTRTVLRGPAPRAHRATRTTGVRVAQPGPPARAAA